MPEEETTEPLSTDSDNGEEAGVVGHRRRRGRGTTSSAESEAETTGH